MAQKFGNAEIQSVQNITSDGTVKRVILDTGADLNVDSRVFNDNNTGAVFGFRRIGFETEFDRRKREREERERGMTVR